MAPTKRRAAPTNGKVQKTGGARAAGRVRGDSGGIIREVAKNAFAESGYHGVSIRDIAQLADVSLATLYYYYPSKQDLLRDLLATSINDFRSDYDVAMRNAGDDTLAQFDALVGSIIRYRATHQVESNLLLRESRNLDDDVREDLTRPWTEVNAALTKIIDDGIAADLFTTPYPDDARRAVFAVCNSIARWYRADGPIGFDELLERYRYLCHTLVDYRSS